MDTLLDDQKPSAKVRPGREPSRQTRERQARREFFYYNPVYDHDTQEIVGHLADISTGGFRLDSRNQVPVERDFRFCVKLTGEVADKPDMVFIARSKWCKVDPLDPYIYNVGYQLIHISPGDLEIFNRMMEKYGREPGNRYIDLRRSNKW
jgi:hypothetical protein